MLLVERSIEIKIKEPLNLVKEGSYQPINRMR